MIEEDYCERLDLHSRPVQGVSTVLPPSEKSDVQRVDLLGDKVVVPTGIEPQPSTLELVKTCVMSKILANKTGFNIKT